MNMIKSAALAAACFIGLATSGANAATALTVAPAPLEAKSNIVHAGYYLPNGIYIPTCHVVVLGYDYWGRMIWRRSCW